MVQCLDGFVEASSSIPSQVLPPSSLFTFQLRESRNQKKYLGDVEGELCEETGVDIVGALDIIGEVKFFLSKKVSHTFHCMLNAEDVIDMQVCGDDAAKDFSEKELVDRWATAIQTKRCKDMLQRVISFKDPGKKR